MKYDAKITLREDNLKEILAEYFGVDREKICFNVVEMQRGARTVNCDIVKEMEFPVKEGTVDIPLPYVPRDQSPPWNPWNPVIYEGPTCGSVSSTQFTFEGPTCGSVSSTQFTFENLEQENKDE